MFTFASLFTLTLIIGFVFVILLLAAYYGADLPMTYVVGLTVLFNAAIWLVAPFIMDLMFKWFYKYSHLSLEDFSKRSPGPANFIRTVCGKYNIPVPKLRFIEDDNPTAFSFGSGAFNARLTFSEGLYKYLNEEEMEAVLAHELGHIQRRDFIIMTIAQTMVQILYELSHMLMRSKGDKKNNLFYIGLVSFVLYYIATYLLLYLSRTREYGADKFAAENVENPDALSRALIKIAYGILAKPDDKNSHRLMNSTRALGLIDTNAARVTAAAYEKSNNDWNFVARVLLFDLVSPWAIVNELASTHPLTGKRIKVLSGFAIQKGKKPSVDFELVKHESYDKHKLYNGFISGLIFHYLPHLAVIGVLIFGAISRDLVLLGVIPIAVGIAIVIKTIYRYPNTQPTESKTLDLMSDVYTSPVRGKCVALHGSIIGRGQAGSHFSEDTMLQDETGLIYLNYESAFSSIGNFIFAIGKVRKLIGQRVDASGWFFRGMTSHLDLHKITAEDHTSIKSRPAMWSFIGAIILVLIGLAAMGNLSAY